MRHECLARPLTSPSTATGGQLQKSRHRGPRNQSPLPKGCSPIYDLIGVRHRILHRLCPSNRIPGNLLSIRSITHIRNDITMLRPRTHQQTSLLLRHYLLLPESRQRDMSPRLGTEVVRGRGCTSGIKDGSIGRHRGGIRRTEI